MWLWALNWWYQHQLYFNPALGHYAVFVVLCLTFTLLICFENVDIYIFAFPIISQHWDDTGSWNPSSFKLRTRSSCIFNTITADGLETQEPRHQQPWHRPSLPRIFWFQHHTSQFTHHFTHIFKQWTCHAERVDNPSWSFQLQVYKITTSYWWVSARKT